MAFWGEIHDLVGFLKPPVCLIWAYVHLFS
jgi:hypothetical protein